MTNSDPVRSYPSTLGLSSYDHPILSDHPRPYSEHQLFIQPSIAKVFDIVAQLLEHVRQVIRQIRAEDHFPPV